MATIKEIIQNFCYRLNLTAPTAFVGVASPAERQYLSLFQFIGDNLRNRPLQWPQLKRGYLFTTETDVSKYEMPGDFYRVLDSTEWDTTNQWPLQGPISDYNFTMREFSIVGLTDMKAYRMIGPIGYLYNTSPYQQRSAGSFEISPAGQNNTDELFFGYISCNWIWPRDWAANTAYVIGNIRSVDGYVYICTGSGTSGATRPSSGASGNITDGSVTWRVYREPYLCTPSNTNLNDSDICLFDEDIMIQGMAWAYKRAKGEDFESLRADWENEIKSALARFQGPCRVNMADQLGWNEQLFPNAPMGSWPV